MKIVIHQTHLTIADFDGVMSYLKANFSKRTKGIHLFPELFLTGYPLQDLCLQRPFINRYESFTKELKNWLEENIETENCCLLMGGLQYELSKLGLPIEIKNVIIQFGDQVNFETIYTKRLLPNYDIFDEKKYFTAGISPGFVKIFNKNIALLICEDMWPSSFHKKNPVLELVKLKKKEKIAFDAVINLSASPYVLEKSAKRLEKARQISNQLECPFFYVNRVGAEDEILFDGDSFIFFSDEEVQRCQRFKEEKLEVSINKADENYQQKEIKKELSWEDLFSAKLELKAKPARLKLWSDEQASEVLQALMFGVQEYAQKNGFKKFTIALSGGIDSALVLTILSLSLKKGQELEAVYMPSIHSSALSYDLSYQLCKNLNIRLRSLPIKFLHSTAKNLFTQTFDESFEGLTDENIQSRLRGLLLYTRTNQLNSMAVNTSNKSELAVGYSTQYGDSVGAISLLGDLFKSEVYRLAHFINENYHNLIPEEILTRGPSAELREDQLDSQSLPPYETLDPILEGILNYRYSKIDLIKLGFDKKDVELVFNLYRKTEYKRYQFCPILKISSKSFGFGYRIPLSKNSSFYNHNI